MKYIVIIQARMTSSRLPGKVLLKIRNRPLLWYLIYRIKKYIPKNNIVIATSNDKSDDIIARFCSKNHIQFYRGSLTNVLERFYYTAKTYKPDIIVRITSDNPLADGQLIKQGLQKFMQGNIDYLSTTLMRTYPVGLDFEIFTFKALETAYIHAKNSYEREHVTPYIYKTRPDLFRLKHFKNLNNKSEYRISVDTFTDFQAVEFLIKEHQAHKRNAEEIISILDKNPQISAINGTA
jgi:spore coat polysaccharide biosynthesis protein SpsF